VETVIGQSNTRISQRGTLNYGAPDCCAS